jgi:hypothetical protein
VLFSVREFWRSMITVLSQWEPLLFRGAADVAAFYKTRPVFCPSGQPKSWLFNFAPGKISLGTLLGCCKRVTRPPCDYGNAKIKETSKC